tara:strand:- start:529 stop:714 length:186 start_codon:yes stop_codon:yes gene_type:complete
MLLVVAIEVEGIRLYRTTPTVHNSLNWRSSVADAKRCELPDEVGGSIPPRAANYKNYKKWI